MAARTLLQLAVDACDEMSIPRPTSLVGSVDANAQNLLGHLQREGTQLAKEEGRIGGWPQLSRVWTFNTSIGLDNYQPPSTLQYFINTTQWDRTQMRPMDGPVSPQAWQQIKSGIGYAPMLGTRFRIIGNALYIDPVPTSVFSISIEYYSNGWCYSPVTGDQSRWTSDNDTAILPEDLFVMGLIWRYRKGKGLDYGQDYDEYRTAVDSALSRASGSAVLDLSCDSSGLRFVDEANIPETGYGGV